MKKLLTKFPALLITLLVGLLAAPSAFGSATIVIQNVDAANVGFNDPTPVAPVGGNPGTTLGQQRLIAFQAAADIWSAQLNSGPTITIRSSWAPLTCTANTAVLGSAGAASVRRDFPGAPFGSTWFGAALGNAIAGNDNQSASAEINARFNLNLGTTGCLEGSGWYLGLDGNHGSKVDLVTVLLHEFGHGLGFQTLTDPGTGAQFGSPNGGQFPTVFDQFLQDNGTGKSWAQMTDAERVTSTTNTGKLVWTGSHVSAAAPAILGNPNLRVNSPASIAGSYQVGTADFGAQLNTAGVTGQVVQATDAADGSGASTTDVCSAVNNPGLVAGKIALIDRGSCNFTVKVKNAQNAGAIGVIIADNQAGAVVGMSGSDPSITIPAVRISQADGVKIKGQLGAGVNASLLLDHSTVAGTDASGHPLLYAPSTYDEGSSVSHWDTSTFPNQLMEPNISGDLSHSVKLPQDLTLSLLQDIGWSTVANSITPPPANPTVSFATTTPTVNENDALGYVSVPVTRTDTSAAASVDYFTSDTVPTTTPCQTNTSGQASDRCDYATQVGTLRFAAGEATKTIQIPIINDVYQEPTETFTLSLRNAQGMTIAGATSVNIQILNDDTAPPATNPINDQAFFIKQQYVDFLGRVAEDAGFNFWMNRMNNCPAGQICDRIDTSQRFFQSDEFQARGFYIYRLYDAVLGRLPKYAEFVPDVARLNGSQTVAEQRASRDAYLLDLINKTEFRNIYGSYLTSSGLAATDAAGFVNALCTRSGITPASKQSLIDNLQNGTKDPAHTLEDFIQTPEVGGVGTRYYDRAIITMQYFGYLRRDPEQAGFDFWQNQLIGPNAPHKGDYRFMVGGFIGSDEYYFRFAFTNH